MKIVLNILWGALCEKNHIVHKITDEKDVDLIDEYIVVGNKEYVKVIENTNVNIGIMK